MKVSYPIQWECEIDELIVKLKELWRIASDVKRYYPSTWKALVEQYNLDWWDKAISDSLLDRKLEILLLQDDELRKIR